VEELRFARADDGVTLGYQVFGQGPVLVWLPSLSNIVAQWRVPALRSAYLALSRHVTVVLYDGRGTGSSDRRIDLADLGVDAHLRDLAAVLDDAGIRRASLLGYYHSVTTAIAYAARHPDRVERMVLFGGAPRLREVMGPAQTQALLSLVDQDWGLFADAAATAWLGWDAAASGRWAAESFRTATTAPVAKAWFAAAREIDVTAEVGQVRAPTLVLHRQGGEQMPVEVSRRLADRLPDARLVELPGTTPTLFIEGAETDLRLVTGFVTDGRADELPADSRGTGPAAADSRGTGPAAADSRGTSPAAADSRGTSPAAADGRGTVSAADGRATGPTAAGGRATRSAATADGRTGERAAGPVPWAGGSAAMAGEPAAGAGRRGSGPPANPLTPREVEVLRCLVAGGSNAEIGRQLGIAVHTVERHLASIYRKVGARGRTDAVAYALTENPPVI
jgi:pimeloyl-ACP methyl ester carboxylesterase/DNA-binding CsgD family transcriptional regulator